MKCITLRLAVLAVGLISFNASARPGLATPSVSFYGLDNAAANSSDIEPRPNANAAFTAFTATLGPYGVETIDNIDTDHGFFPGIAIDPGMTFRNANGAGSPMGITAESHGVFASDATPSQKYSIDQKSMPESDAYLPVPQENSRFNFNQFITAFGLYVMQAGDVGNHTQITFQLKNTATNLSDSYTVDAGPGWQDHNIFFLGLASPFPFNEVTILEHALNVGGVDDLSDGMVYDNIVAGTFVPEPGSLVLLSLGGTWAYALGRTRRCRRG